ncbi:MAG: hypothetical protein JG764_656 [Clostridiales bacterium]|jgi:ACT domain-containing protein|nr:hypothetical protein [Clostridiales bacterium]
MKNSRVVVTVVGKDKVGIIAAVTGVLAEAGANILDISQTIMQDFFTMIMIVDIANINTDYSTVVEKLGKVGKELGVQIAAQNEEVFNYMHRI